jgi:hypothetical protein
MPNLTWEGGAEVARNVFHKQGKDLLVPNDRVAEDSRRVNGAMRCEDE